MGAEPVFGRMVRVSRANGGAVNRGPDPRWLDPTVEGYQGPCARRAGGPECRCSRCEPRQNPKGYATLECGCVLDGPDGGIVFMNPTCLERVAQGRSRGLASAGSRADQSVLINKVMALHELDRGRTQPTRGFSRSGLRR